EDAAGQVPLDFAVVLDQEVPPRAHDPAEQRREDDLVRPVHRPAQLAQAPRDQQAAGEKAQREDHAKALDRYAQHVEGRFHAWHFMEPEARSATIEPRWPPPPTPAARASAKTP